MRIGPLKLNWDSIQWGAYGERGEYAYYFQWWHTLAPEVRHWGASVHVL